MDWTFVNPFLPSKAAQNNQWLVPYVPGDRHQFQFIFPPQIEAQKSWHLKRSPVTHSNEWRRYWQQSGEAFQNPGGFITTFPQLAATLGLRQRLSLKHRPVIAWCFNMGVCYSGLKGRLAQVALGNVDAFIVHSRQERESYSRWLNLPIERFEFVPYQVPELPITDPESTTDPFIVAMGSAQRDYALLFEAVKRLNLRTVVIAGSHALQGLDVPPQVEVRSGLTLEECYRLAQQARVNVVPLLDREIATGPSTIVAAMRLNRSVIATRTTGSVDYIIDGETGYLTPPSSVEALSEAIAQVWYDDELRQRLNHNAGAYAAAHFSDQAAGKALGQVLDRVADAIGVL
jgi:glycosyltransferase involved in cell wall biosynthesis